MVNYPISFPSLLVFCHKEPNMPRQQLRVQWDLFRLPEAAFLLCELDFQIYRDQSYGKGVHTCPSRSLGVMGVWSLWFLPLGVRFYIPLGVRAQHLTTIIDLGCTVCYGKWSPIIARYHLWAGAVFRNPLYYVPHASSIWMMLNIIGKVDSMVMYLLPPLLCYKLSFLVQCNIM